MQTDEQLPGDDSLPETDRVDASYWLRNIVTTTAIVASFAAGLLVPRPIPQEIRQQSYQAGYSQGAQDTQNSVKAHLEKALELSAESRKALEELMKTAIGEHSPDQSAISSPEKSKLESLFSEMYNPLSIRKTTPDLER